MEVDVLGRYSATRWVLGSVGVASVLALGFSAAIGVTALQLRSAQQRQSEVYAAARQQSEALLAAFVDQETGMRGYVLTADPVLLEPYRRAGPQIRRALIELRATTDDVTETGALVTDVETAYDDWQGYAATQLDLVDRGERETAAGRTATLDGKTRFDVLRTRMALLTSLLDGRARDNAVVVRTLQQRLLALAATTLVVLALVLAAGTWLLLRGLVRPVRALAVAARRVADGDLSATIPVAGSPEVVQVASDVRAMRDRLLADAHQVRLALDAVEQQGPAVSALREALAPQVGRVAGLSVSGRLDPAQGLLAGDWYDLIPVSTHRLALVLGDVAGHGPRSAVLALRLKHALAAALRTGVGPGEALATTSRSLLDVPAELFATVLAVVIDTATDRLVYANAGHPAALLLSRALAPGETLNPREHATDLSRHLDAGHGMPVTWLDLPSTGPLLSPVVAGWSWSDAEHGFKPGDTLIAFTDGLLEARDGRGEQFGVTGVVDVLAATGTDDGTRLLDALAAAAHRHLDGTPRRDDQTLLYARRTELLATLAIR